MSNAHGPTVSDYVAHSLLEKRFFDSIDPKQTLACRGELLLDLVH